MKPLLPMTQKLRDKIKMNIKNKIDISSLIEDIDFKGEDLSGAIITKLVRTDADISNCNFSHTTLGDETGKSVFSLIRCKMRNCNFHGAKFVGKTWIRSCDARNCNFKHADISRAEYQYTDFRDCTFCESIIRIGTKDGLGCIFPTQMFDDLCKGWRMKIKAEHIK